jgi:hypothetical protein
MARNGSYCLRLACPKRSELRRRRTSSLRYGFPTPPKARSFIPPGHVAPGGLRPAYQAVPYGEASGQLTENVNLMLNQPTADECNAAAEELTHYPDAGLPETGSSWLPSYTT